MKKLLILVLISAVLLSLLIIPSSYRYKIVTINEKSNRFEIVEGHEEKDNTQPTGG